MPPSTRQAEYAAEWLRSQGFAAPTWASLLDGAAMLHGADADDGGPVAMHKGWQRCAGAAVEKRALEMFFSNLDSASRALLLSQCGPGASYAMTVLPTGTDFTVPSDEFRILLLGRLRMRLPLAPNDAAAGGWQMCRRNQNTGEQTHRISPKRRAANKVTPLCRHSSPWLA